MFSHCTLSITMETGTEKGQTELSRSRMMRLCLGWVKEVKKAREAKYEQVWTPAMADLWIVFTWNLLILKHLASSISYNPDLWPCCSLFDDIPCQYLLSQAADSKSFVSKWHLGAQSQRSHTIQTTSKLVRLLSCGTSIIPSPPPLLLLLRPSSRNVFDLFLQGSSQIPWMF